MSSESSSNNKPIPEMISLIEALQSRIPMADGDASRTRIAHGDYRLDNLVYDNNNRILAILDWELATLGDPLADLAYNCLPYHLPPGIPGLITFLSSTHNSDVDLPAGIPSEKDYIQWYCHSSGSQPPSPQDWSFYVSLSLFRLAAILAGVGARAAQGNASSRNAAAMGSRSVVTSLAIRALDVLHKKQKREDTKEEDKTILRIDLHRGLGPSKAVHSILVKLETFMSQYIFPAEAILQTHATSKDRWTIHPLQESLKKEAKSQGLWNLWIPPDMARHLAKTLFDNNNNNNSDNGITNNSMNAKEPLQLVLGPGLSNVDYAHCAEIMGQSPWAPEAMNCSAPDTGNMEVLARYGSIDQQKRWLVPLLMGDIRSCFAMTEPDVASSDATNIKGSITECIDNDNNSGRCGKEVGKYHYNVNGRKWWTSGACDPRCAVAIFMGKTEDSANKAVHEQQSMILVPMSHPGVTIVRPLTVFGYDDAPHGHAEVVFDNVKVDASGLILGKGRGFEIAQGRLGPGRLHHCMRLIGMGERGLLLMKKRAVERVAFGKPLGGHQSVRLDIAKSRMELDAARLVVLEAARALDEVGAANARFKIAQAKALAPTTVLTILDRAIQVHGGAGVSDDVPLAMMYSSARTLRLADGPDVVHLETIAKGELKHMMMNGVAQRSKM
jgi:acyl-CoA dehydrogenase